MTELVDEIKIHITLRHCMDELRIDPLRYILSVLWDETRVAMNPCSEGIKEFEDGKIIMRWSNTGLHEIPEEGGGDN